MKPDQTLPNGATASKPFQSVQTPTPVKYGAAIAFILFFTFIAFYYFGPKSSSESDSSARPVAGEKAQAPLGSASTSQNR